MRTPHISNILLMCKSDQEHLIWQRKTLKLDQSNSVITAYIVPKRHQISKEEIGNT